jgi:hypothetical protein
LEETMNRIALGVSLTIAAGLLGCGGGECRDGWMLCNGVCIDVWDASSNCGGCGIVCRSGYCDSGVCGCSNPGQSACRDADGSYSCTNTRSDRDNCGVCGRGCAAAETCTDGVCVAPTCTPLCAIYQYCQGGSCFDRWAVEGQPCTDATTRNHCEMQGSNDARFTYCETNGVGAVVLGSALCGAAFGTGFQTCCYTNCGTAGYPAEDQGVICL